MNESASTRNGALSILTALTAASAIVALLGVVVAVLFVGFFAPPRNII